MGEGWGTNALCCPCAVAAHSLASRRDVRLERHVRVMSPHSPPSSITHLSHRMRYDRVVCMRSIARSSGLRRRRAAGGLLACLAGFARSDSWLCVPDPNPDSTPVGRAASHAPPRPPPCTLWGVAETEDERATHFTSNTSQRVRRACVSRSSSRGAVEPR